MPDLRAVKSALAAQRLELPSWAFGSAGPQVELLARPGAARTPEEKIADAAQVHALTGAAPRVALRIPGDRGEDYAGLARFAAEHGVAIGTVSASALPGGDGPGSIAHPDAGVRRRAVDRLLECVDVLDATGADSLRLWLADGISCAGQDDIGGRQDRLAGALAQVHARLGGHQRMLIEYELSEPSLYAADVPDWGTSLLQCLALGPGARVVVSTTHQVPGVTTEFIVALLLRAGQLGGLSLTSPLRGDDDLMAAGTDPFQLFRILREVVAAGAHRPSAGVVLLLDQCDDLGPPIPAQIRSVLRVQEATAKALLVDVAALAAAQRAGDAAEANAILMDACQADARPLLAGLRQDLGLDPDPVAAYQRSRYQEHIVSSRIGSIPARRA